MDTSRLLTTALLTPAGERAQDRRRRRRLTGDLQRTARTNASSQEADTDRDTEKATWLPRSGEHGPAALRAWLPFRVPPHAATSATLAGAYPFLAEAGLGSDGVLIGTDLLSGGSFVYDPWQLYRQGVLTNPNVLLAGVIGTGKSALAKSLATRSLAFGIRIYVPGDPKGEWTAVTEAVGGTAVTLGHGLTTRLNPLDEGRRPAGLGDREWSVLVWSRRRELLGVLSETVLGRPLQPVEHTALDGALAATTATSSVPTLPAVVGRLLDPRGETPDETSLLLSEGRDLAHALRRMVHGDLAGLFDGESTVRFDPSAPMISLDLSGVSGNDTLLSLVMTCASTWMEAALLDPDGGRRWVVYDEAWRVMRHPALIRRMQSQWKLSRAYGIANLMVIHRLSDLDAVGDQRSEARALAQGLLADCSTRIVYRQESDQLTTSAATLGLTDTERDLLPTLGIGQGLWRIRDRAFIVQHQMTPGELDVFDTTARMT
ncbi:VirB4 family type IV secretion system protein [Georgenia faecalis]|uniref:VirB4 family type IV secretion system protein n=1 Tax=Georgenia faecalis TaxID=2483799 RepID=UPI000FD840E3|nr:ATP-binding protein [Georgenia faecalis]